MAAAGKTGSDEGESIPPRNADEASWAWIGCSIEARRLAVTSEHEVGVRGANLSEIAKGGATGCLPVQAKTKPGPTPE